MSILTVGSSPDRGMRLNLPIAIVPLRCTDTGFQSPAAYLEDEQMLRILGRGHSVPTVTELESSVRVPQGNYVNREL
jgi:hypothetical protein